MAVTMGFLGSEKAATESKVESEEKAAVGDIEETIQAGSMQQEPLEREKEETALVRRIDLFLMPALWFMYLFSYADRTK
jgi:hypothetical protein